METIQSDIAIEVLKDLGTAGGLEFFDMMGSLPSKYWTLGENPGAYNLSGAAMADSILTGNTGCWGCSVQCGREVTIEMDGKTITTDGPEYECVVSLGTNLLIDDLNAVSQFDFICDAMGMDVITAGAVIGFATYLTDEGLISAEQTDGIALEWNNPAQVRTLLEKIVRRDGIGNLMADGVRAMETAFGVPGLGVQINGMDPGMHDPRGFSGTALVYLTSPRGACHNKSDFYFVEIGHTFEKIGVSVDDQHQEQGKAPFVVWHQNYRSMVDSSGMCNFVNMPLDILPDTFKAVWGNDLSLNELLLLGERIFNLKRLLNLKLGMVPRRDEVMPKLLTVPYAEGATEGFVPDWEMMLKEYLDKLSQLMETQQEWTDIKIFNKLN
jgi:aldehyde:ferredoxin oxidoreductase